MSVQRKRKGGHKGPWTQEMKDKAAHTRAAKKSQMEIPLDMIPDAEPRKKAPVQNSRVTLALELVRLVDRIIKGGN